MARSGLLLEVGHSPDPVSNPTGLYKQIVSVIY